MDKEYVVSWPLGNGRAENYYGEYWTVHGPDIPGLALEADRIGRIEAFLHGTKVDPSILVDLGFWAEPGKKNISKQFPQRYDFYVGGGKAVFG